MAVSLSDSPPSQGPSCPVCFRDYGDSETNLIPRILQCGHTYCSECLDKLLNTEPDEDEYQQVVLNIRYAGREWTTTRNYPRTPHTTNELKCPTCKAVNHIQNRDITSLTKNFALLGCRPQTAGTGNRNKHFCKDHDHEKRIYCNDCKILICAYCQLYGGHRGHNFMVATEASKPSIDSLRAAEKSLSEELGSLTTGVNSLNSTISKLAKTRNKCEKSVRQYFGGAIARLESQQDSLLAQISSWTEEQMYILNAQLDMLTSSMKELKTIQSNCQSLIVGDPLDALTDQQMVEEEVERLQEHIKDVSLQPLINPWMRAKEEGPYDDTLNALVGNFKLTYDADTLVGEDNAEMEVEGGRAQDDPSGNESDSSGDSLMGGSVGLSNVLEVYRLRSLENRRRRGALNNSENEETGGRSKGKQVYSQETQSLAANFAPREGAIGLQDTDTPTSGHWIANHPSSSFSPFNQRNPLLLDDSGSNSDLDNLPGMSQDMPSFLRFHPTAMRRRTQPGVGDGDRDSGRVPTVDLSTDDSDHDLEEIIQQHQATELALSSMGTGVESVLDSLEIRRHWNFLNGDGGRGRGGRGPGESSRDHRAGDSSKEEDEEEEDTTDLNFHTMVPLPLSYHTEGRSAHSDSDSPPPHGPSGGANSTDFAFSHHLSLPVDSGRDPDDEVVFPTTAHYAWADQLNGRGRALQLNIGASGLVQLSLQPDNSDREDGGSNSEAEDEEGGPEL